MSGRGDILYSLSAVGERIKQRKEKWNKWLNNVIGKNIQTFSNFKGFSKMPRAKLHVLRNMHNTALCLNKNMAVVYWCSIFIMSNENSYMLPRQSHSAGGSVKTPIEIPYTKWRAAYRGWIFFTIVKKRMHRMKSFAFL